MPTLPELFMKIRAAHPDSEDEQELALMLAEAVSKLPAADRVTLLYNSLARPFVRANYRAETRHREHVIMNPPPPVREFSHQNEDGSLNDGPPVMTMTRPEDSAFRRWLRDSQVLDEAGNRKLTGEMTDTDWAQRRNYLSRISARAVAQVSLIDKVREVLEKSGCETLDEFAAEGHVLSNWEQLT